MQVACDGLFHSWLSPLYPVILSLDVVISTSSYSIREFCSQKLKFDRCFPVLNKGSVTFVTVANRLIALCCIEPSEYNRDKLLQVAADISAGKKKSNILDKNTTFHVIDSGDHVLSTLSTQLRFYFEYEHIREYDYLFVEQPISRKVVAAFSERSQMYEAFREIQNSALTDEEKLNLDTVIAGLIRVNCRKLYPDKFGSHALRMLSGMAGVHLPAQVKKAYGYDDRIIEEEEKSPDPTEATAFSISSSL